VQGAKRKSCTGRRKAATLAGRGYDRGRGRGRGRFTILDKRRRRRELGELKVIVVW
jgi:hypothetical protein